MSASAAALGVTLALYLAGASALGANLFLRRAGLLTGGRGVALLAAISHAVAIGLRCVEVHRAPVTTPGESLSLLAWMVTLAYLGAELLWRLSAAGPFALGLSFLLVLLGALAPGGNATASSPALLAENAISLHIIAILAAIGAFALAFCCAVLYLIENRILKSKHGLVWMKRLPPLLTVETAAFTLVAVGFPLLTLGILSGFVRAAQHNGLPPGWQTDPKALLAYAVWAVYGAYLAARIGANWPPARTAYILLIGLALCLLLFFIPSATHRFG